MTTPNLFPDDTFDDVNLSEDARRLTKEATAAMRAWIEQGVTALQDRLATQVGAALQELEAFRAEQVRQIQADAAEIERIDAAIRRAVTALPTLDKALVKNLTQSVASMKDELKRREKRAGEIGSVALAAAKKAIGLPV